METHSSSMNGTQKLEWHRTYAWIEHKGRYALLLGIIAANGAILAGVFVSLILYCPIPDPNFITRSVLLTSFVIGVLGAATYLRLPTLGVTNFNVSQHFNPISLVGKVLGLIIFGPTIIALKTIDRTNYSDAHVVDGICQALEQDSLPELLKDDPKIDKKSFEGRFSTFYRMGLINQQTPNKANKWSLKYDVLKRQKADLIKARGKDTSATNNHLSKELQVEDKGKEKEEEVSHFADEEQLQEIKGKMEAIENKWLKWQKDHLVGKLPRPPKKPLTDYKKWYVRLYSDFIKTATKQLHSS